MKKKWVVLICFVLLVGGGAGYWLMLNRQLINPFRKRSEKTEMPLDKYDFDSLRARQGRVSEIKIGGVLAEVEKRRGKLSVNELQKAGVQTSLIRFQSDGKVVSGMINLPAGRQVISNKSSLSPVIIMIRGYSDKAGYYPGFGTWRVADELAKAGFATISLDFLGYGLSDSESGEVMEARFHKVVETVDLIESVKALPWVDKNRVGIWAHSNGGQIALSVLEVTSGRYPTILWAPMTNPFPRSLIDTADDGEEKQKAIDFVNVFLKKYDGRRYAIENYYERVKSPIEIEQGTADIWCKVEWQQNVKTGIEAFGQKVTLNVYPGDDHNLSKNWNVAVDRAKEFYNLVL